MTEAPGQPHPPPVDNVGHSAEHQPARKDSADLARPLLAAGQKPLGGTPMADSERYPPGRRADRRLNPAPDSSDPAPTREPAGQRRRRRPRLATPELTYAHGQPRP